MKTNKRKKILIAVLLAVMMAVPIGLSAQTDGFFSSWNDGNRDGGSASPGGVNNGTFGMDDSDSGVNNESFVGEAPLGCGLLILAASAAGYAVLKKRKVES